MAIGTAAALLAGGALSAGASIFGANRSANAVKSAASSAADVQGQIYGDISGKLAPFAGLGSRSIEPLLYELGLRKGRPNMIKPDGSKGEGVYQGYEMSPMAQYLLNEGVDTIESGAAARGMLHSGRALKALDDYRGNIVKSDRDAYLNRLFGLVGIGQNSAAAQASAGQNYAGNVGNTMMTAGQATAQGWTDMANTINAGIGNAASIYGYMNPMQTYAQGFRPQQPGTGGLY